MAARSRVAGCALVVVAAILLAGCAGKPPEIGRVLARIVYQHAEGGAVAGLSVFMVATDPDGMEDLSAFYIINDDAELFWKVDSAAWVKATADGETWIGTNALTMPAGAPVPGGQYRAVLEDAAGETAEMPFTVPAPANPPGQAIYPSASVAGNAIQVSGPFPSYELWVYGPDGSFVATFPIPDPSKPLEITRMISANPALAQGFTFRAYAYNEKGGYGVLSDPGKSGTLQPR